MLKKRSEALLHGDSHYFTGKPCKRGHIEERITLSGKCVYCDIMIYRKTKKTNDNWVNGKNAKDSKKRRIDSIKKASNAFDRWSVEDINIVTKTDSSRRCYIYTANYLAELLGRSCQSIEHIRSRFSEIVRPILKKRER